MADTVTWGGSAPGSTAAPPATGQQPGAAPPAVGGTPARALSLATLGFFGGFAGVSIFGPLVPKFADVLGLGPFAAGMLAAVPSLTGSLLRIPFGAAVDKAGGRRPFLLLLGVANLGVIALLVLLATSYPARMGATYPLLLLLGALVGCGIATFSVGVGQVSYWFRRREQGAALGVYAGLGNTGPGLSTILLPLALGSLGLVGAYSIWYAVLAAITLVYALFIRDAPFFQLRARGLRPDVGALRADGRLVPAGSARAGLARAARVPATWALVFLYFLSFGGFLALTSWLPTYWHQMYGESLRAAGLLTATFSLVSALVRVPGGRLADRLPMRPALAGTGALMLVGALLVSFSSAFWPSFAGTLVLGIGMGLQNAVVFTLVPAYVPDAVGGGSGWVGGLGAFGGFAIPPLMGAVTGAVGDPTGYARGFLPVAALVLLALPVGVWLSRWSTDSGAAARRSLPETPGLHPGRPSTDGPASPSNLHR